MEYCKFENTLEALKECLKNGTLQEVHPKASEYEKNAYKALVTLIKHIAEHTREEK